MIALLDNLFVTIVRSLPMLFVLGASPLLLLLALAALLDAKLPHAGDGGVLHR